MLVWDKEWNNILRYVFFSDAELKRLMKIPANTGIIPFLDKYFIQAGFTNELLTSEDVRIIYSFVNMAPTNAPNIHQKMLQFDIYVKKDILRNATNDRLLLRTSLIEERLRYLLLHDQYVENTGYRFRPGAAVDLGTRTVGYVRRMVPFYFNAVEY